MNVLTVSALPSQGNDYPMVEGVWMLSYYTLFSSSPGKGGGKMYKMCNILSLLHWKRLVLDKDMKLILTGLLWSETTKEKNAVNTLVYKGAYLSTAETLLNTEYFMPVTFQLRKSKKRQLQQKPKICLRASQPFLILFCKVAKYSRFFPFCPFSCVHILSPESFWVI